MGLGIGRSGLLLLRKQNKQTRFYSVKTENMALGNKGSSTNHNRVKLAQDQRGFFEKIRKNPN